MKWCTCIAWAVLIQYEFSVLYLQLVSVVWYRAVQVFLLYNCPGTQAAQGPTLPRTRCSQG